jgi:hypothetical protein
MSSKKTKVILLKGNNPVRSMISLDGQILEQRSHFNIYDVISLMLVTKI